MQLSGFKKKLFLEIGIALGGALLLSVFIILLNIDINKQADAIEETKVQLALRTRTLELLTSSKGDVERADLFLTRLQSMVPTEEQLIALPREFQRIAKTYDVDADFRFIGSQQPGSEQQLGTMKFSLSMIGLYDNVLQFLEFIESSQYIMVLDLGDMSRSKDKEGDKFSLIANGTLYIK